MFLGLKVVLNLIYKGFRGPLRSFDAPFTYIDIDTCGVDKAHKRLELKLWPNILTLGAFELKLKQGRNLSCYPLVSFVNTTSIDIDATEVFIMIRMVCLSCLFINNLFIGMATVIQNFKMDLYLLISLGITNEMGGTPILSHFSPILAI